MFRLFALSFPVVLILLAELGLRVAGTGYPTTFLVPHPTKPGYLVDNYKFAWRFFPKALARAPRPIVIQERKPDNTIRVCVFGGSAAMGDPEPAYGMPRVIETLLRNRCPDQTFEVVNCAVTAINSHVVRDIANDCRVLDADAWLIYLGNNEVHGPFGAGTVFGRSDRPLWLNRAILSFKATKIGQLVGNDKANENAPKKWGGMQMFLDQKVPFADTRLKKVYNDFETNLAAIINTAAPKTKIIMGTVACNLKDFPPFVSEYSATSGKGPSQWLTDYELACKLQDENNHADALAKLEAISKVVPQEYAEYWFRRGQSCWALRAEDNSKAVMAKSYFDLARDLDALRFRADYGINSRIREVANATQTPLVETESVLVGEADIVGDEYLYEHVHFNFAGNYKVGKAFAQEIVRELKLLKPNEINDGWISQLTCAEQLGLSPFHERLTLMDVRGRLGGPPFSEQIGHKTRDAKIAAEMERLVSQMTPQLGQQTVANLKSLAKERPNDWLLRQQLGLLLDSVGDLQGAATEFAAIAEQLPHNAEAQFRLGAQYNRLKQRQKAETALRHAIELRPDFVRAHNSLGICLSHQDRAKESYQHFQTAVSIQPSFAEAYVNWALVLAANGEADLAVEKYRRAIEADERNLKAHAELGKHFVAGNALQDAVPHYEAIAKLLPNDTAAQLNLGMLYLKFGGHEAQARSQFERTLELSPGNQQALAGLQHLQ